MAPRPQESDPAKKALVKVTWAKFQRVCDHLAQYGLKEKACQAFDLQHNTVNAVIAECAANGDHEWEELWNNSYTAFTDSLEAEATRRGRDGWQEPVYYKGEEVGEVTKFSDRMLELQLKSHMPHKYSEQLRITGRVTARQERQTGVELLSKLSLSAQREIRRIITKDLADQAAANPDLLEEEAPSIDGDFNVIEDHREPEPAQDEWEDPEPPRRVQPKPDRPQPPRSQPTQSWRDWIKDDD